MRVLSYSFAAIVVLILVIIFYIYYLVAGDWQAVELSVLDTIISIVVAFIVNVTAVIIGIDIAIEGSDPVQTNIKK